MRFFHLQIVSSWEMPTFGLIGSPSRRSTWKVQRTVKWGRMYCNQFLVPFQGFPAWWSFENFWLQWKGIVKNAWWFLFGVDWCLSKNCLEKRDCIVASENDDDDDFGTTLSLIVARSRPSSSIHGMLGRHKEMHPEIWTYDIYIYILYMFKFSIQIYLAILQAMSRYPKFICVSDWKKHQVQSIPFYVDSGLQVGIENQDGLRLRLPL